MLSKARRLPPTVKRIREKGKGLDFEIKVPGFGPKAKMKDVVIFTRQFATMIDAGLPLVQGIGILGKGHENLAMRKALTDVRERIESGVTLAEALSHHPKVFDDLFVNMVAAGESGGILDIILERLAVYLEKMDQLRRQVKTAMIYPGVVVSAAGIVSSILLIFVIPTFADMFADFGAALPAPTRIVMNISDFFVNYYILLFGAMGAMFYMFKNFSATERGKEILHPIYLKMPVFGEIIRKVAVAPLHTNPWNHAQFGCSNSRRPQDLRQNRW